MTEYEAVTDTLSGSDLHGQRKIYCDVPVVEERMKVANHRIADLERKIENGGT